MSILAHGIDIVLCSRIERAWHEHGQKFLDRLFTAAEQRYCREHRTPEIRLAGRFAVKEAVFKALGTGWRGGVEWTDVETLPDRLGKPVTALSGEAARLASTLGIETLLVSITHAGDYACASVIAVGK